MVASMSLHRECPWQRKVCIPSEGRSGVSQRTSPHTLATSTPSLDVYCYSSFAFVRVEVRRQDSPVWSPGKGNGTHNDSIEKTLRGYYCDPLQSPTIIAWAKDHLSTVLNPSNERDAPLYNGNFNALATSLLSMGIDPGA